MRGAWNPWETLRRREDVVLRWAWLPEGHEGTVARVGAEWAITLDAGLGRVGRRCALAHELVHVERGLIVGPWLVMVREEAIVRAETARRLVPPGELVGTVDRLVGLDVGVEACHVAEVFDVTETVAYEALAALQRLAA